MNNSLTQKPINTPSYWEQETFLTHYDVLIIGSGIVGLNTAIRLKQQAPALKVGVLERGLLPDGASTKNAGFACFGSVSELIEQLKRSSEEELCQLISLRWNGLIALRELLGDDAIRYNNWGGYELFTAHNTELFEHCVDRLSYFNKLVTPIIGKPDIYAVTDAKIAGFGFARVAHLIENKAEAQLDTGRMMQALLLKAQSLGVLVFNGVSVSSIATEQERVLVHTNSYQFSTKKVVLATNAFTKQLYPAVDVIPGRGQVLVTKPIANLKLKGTFHYDKGYYYFRNIDDRILIGGGRHLDFAAENTYQQGETAVVQQHLEELLHTVVLPKTPVEIDQRWSGIMGFGSMLSPIVEQIDTNVYCAVRCNGMGVAMGSIIGIQAADMVLKKL